MAVAKERQLDVHRGAGSASGGTPLVIIEIRLRRLLLWRRGGEIPPLAMGVDTLLNHYSFFTTYYPKVRVKSTNCTIIDIIPPA